MKHISLEERVRQTWNEAKGSCEEDESGDGAVLGFEALEQWYQREEVEEEMEDGFVYERKGV